MDKYHKSKGELSRKRSRSPIHRDDDDDEKYERDRNRHKCDDYKRRSRSSSSSSDERNKRIKSAVPPAAPRISMSFNKSGTSKAGIQIKLNSQPAKPAPIIQKSAKISNVFNNSDSEPEEMPQEAKMRMRNIGKETPTSSGPNSFGKTKQGFIDSKKIFERKLKQMADEISND